MNEKVLSVRLHGDPIGVLQMTRDGKLRFEYIEGATRAVSLMMPFSQRRYGKFPCEIYFGGLLPESIEARRAIAGKFEANPNSTFSLLKAIGYDCAGAVSIQSAEDPIEDDRLRQVQIEPLSEEVLERHIQELPQMPLFCGVEGLRVSLSGVQEKAAVCVVDGQVYLPARGTPTTHVLKPSIRNYPATVQNEYLCLRVAGRMGLPVPDVKIRRARGKVYLLVERYDRKFEDGGQIVRLHQEDFAQATGVQEKYQRYGGPGLKECFDLLLKSFLPVIDRSVLMEVVVFNYLIGNTDAHAKNFAILHDEWGNFRLAPFYDILCTQVYPDLSGEMAMKIGKCYILERVSTRDWEGFCEKAGLSYPVLKNMLRRQAESLPYVLREERRMLSGGEFDTGIADEMVKQVERNCARVLRLLSKP